MKIKKIILDNIRSHKNSEVDLNQGICVFTGRTGCGKSSILMALEYGLFGVEGGLNNSAILRRDVQKGSVTLEFEERGNNYIVKRGLKHSGKNITTDISNMLIIQNNEPLPLLGRATDLNKKILEILGYPSDIKPKDLFEITSYTRQDEIRALIEMGGEKRQERIDKILQLSKYKSTWENMKDLVSVFETELKEAGIRLENLEDLQKEVIKIKTKTIENDHTIKENENKLSKLNSDYSKITKEKNELDGEIRSMLEKRRQLDKTKGTISGLTADTELQTKKIEAIRLRKEELQKQLDELGRIGDFEELQNRNIKLLAELERFEKELEHNKKEFEKIKVLGIGNCPTCKQKIESGHIEHLEKEFKTIFEKLTKNIEGSRLEQEKLEPLIRNSKLASEIKDSQKHVEENLNERTNQLNEKIKTLELSRQEELELESTVTDISKKEELLRELSSKERELFSKINATTEITNIKKEENRELQYELLEKEKTVTELEHSKEKMQVLEKTINTLVRMREDIRNIREIIRKNFLEDFRQEFQKKFEEIRKYEEEYAVDVKPDYEPVAYTSNGEEVPISNLSGGEKTSVALSYRLALADLAAQVSAINPSEILILDEPTTGFDQEDIKALPNALRNIQTIPQIIIVTHEEELKNAADYKYQITKEGNSSFISKTD